VGQWSVGGAIALGALALAAPYAFGEQLIHDRGELVIFAIVSACFGLFIGHSWFRTPTGEQG
jgi:hypothetical protein